MEESTDQKVFWGPVSINEIKKLLSHKKPPEAIGRRASICNDEPSRTIYSDSPTTDYLIKKQFFGNADDELCVSFTSEYFTPNETLHNDKSGMSSYASSTPNKSFHNQVENNENFIEKVSKALSSSSSTAYVSAAECLNLKYENEESRKTSLNSIGKAIREIPKIEQEADIILVSDEDDDAGQDIIKLSELSEECSELEVTHDRIRNRTIPDIYIISDGDSSFEIQREIKNEQLSSVSLQLNENSSKISRKSSVQVQVNEDDAHLNKSSTGSTSSPIHNVSLTMSTANSDIHSDSAINLLYDQNNVDVIPGKYQYSENLNQNTRDELSEPSSSSDYGFNDTLEEMEMALKNGLDYVMPNELGNSNQAKTDIPNTSDLDEPVYKHNLESSPNKQSYEKLNPIQEIGTRIPKAIKNVTPQIKLQKFSPLKIHDKQNFEFKIPSKPPCVTRNKTPDFKNVLSPVAVYIKNSPRVPQVQHVSAKTLPKGPLFPKQSGIKNNSNKENAESLPTRIYKPTKCLITSKEKNIKLPVNIQKHLPNVPDIIKHTGRIGIKKKDSTLVQAKLLDENLTICNSDSSVLNSSESVHEISLLTTKKTYIT